MLKCDLNKAKLSNFIEITLWHGCSSLTLLDIFRTLFLGTTLDGCFCIFSGNLKKTHTDQVYYKFCYSVRKEKTLQTPKSNSCKTIFLQCVCYCCNLVH